MDSKFKSTSLEEMIDKHIGKIGTPPLAPTPLAPICNRCVSQTKKNKNESQI